MTTITIPETSPRSPRIIEYHKWLCENVTKNSLGYRWHWSTHNGRINGVCIESESDAIMFKLRFLIE